MAKTQGVWGIDIGQCAVKALRCLPGDEPGTIVADAFDYIEYPKILSQPDSNPEELIAEALRQFLSRNQVQGDRVAISVAGQSGLARFVKLPPVEVKKIPDLVRYEARNQIPFDLDEVIWDFQQMGGGMIEEGFAIDIEMGLFAMKREQVEKALRPFEEAKVEIDVVQLTPLALYNFLVFDQLHDSLPDSDFYDPENPPDSTMIISLGTETTDLVITDGFRVWQRSLPIGGSHFTKALTKELKQTFAKAEHIKRNAAQAENPKALFQAMRPIFADLVTEVQRSMNFFSNVHKKANISGGIALGSTGKLPGLVRFLSQNLKMPITRVESFRGLRGPGVVDAPAFQENMLAFAVCYGLCVQSLGESAIQTNLIPRELLVDRMVRAKKPWAAGALGALALGLAASFALYWQSTLTVRPDAFSGPEAAVKAQVDDWGKARQKWESGTGDFQKASLTGEHLVLDRAKMLRWSQLYRAIDACTPRQLPPGEGEPPVEFRRRNDVFITSITSRRRDLSQWHAEATAAPSAAGGDKAAPGAGGVGPGAIGPPGGGGGGFVPGGGQPGLGGGGVPGQQPGAAKAPSDGPQGTGFVIRIEGFHFHNLAINDGGGPDDQGAAFLRKAFLANLEQDALPMVGPNGHPFPAPDSQELVSIPVKAQGIAYPLLLTTDEPKWNEKVRNPFFVAPEVDAKAKAGDAKAGDAKAGDVQNDDKMNPEFVVRYDFVVEFAWYDKPPEAEKKTGGKPGQPGGAKAPGLVAQGPAKM